MKKLLRLIAVIGALVLSSGTPAYAEEWPTGPGYFGTYVIRR